MKSMRYVVTESPLGPLTVVADDAGLTGVFFERHRHDPGPRDDWRPADDETAASRIVRETARQLGEYFAGTRRTFDLPLAPRGTAFQQRVWERLRAIPFGATASYVEIARALGDPKATRAVGAANGRNPISIVVPCHRVIGADGALTGFGGGIERKRWLLAHEGALPGEAQLTLMD
jgi:methylated-DNA-[protein]-cysteine S-methyltransferase